MSRLIVSLMVILSLCIVNQSISHPGDGASVNGHALCSWSQPQGHGDGEIKIDTWLSYQRGTHNLGEPHEDGGHQFEGLQNRIMYDLHGNRVYFKYFYDLRTVHNSNKITIAPTPYTRSAERCFDCYAYAHGKFRWGNTKIYSSPSTTKSHPIKLPRHKCGGSTQAYQEEPIEAVFDELRLVVEMGKTFNPDIIGAVNENGIIHTHNGNVNQEFDATTGMVSGVTSVIPAAPPMRKPKMIALTWASLKRK